MFQLEPKLVSQPSNPAISEGWPAINHQKKSLHVILNDSPPSPKKAKNQKTACRLIWSILADGNEGRSAARFFVICITIRRTWVCLWMTAAALLSLFGCQSASPQAGRGWDNKHAPCSCWVSSVYLKFSSHFRSINTSVNIQLFPRTLKLFVFPCMKTACPAYCNRGGEMLWNYRAVYLPVFFFFFFHMGPVSNGDADSRLFIQGEFLIGMWWCHV